MFLPVAPSRVWAEPSAGTVDTLACLVRTWPGWAPAQRIAWSVRVVATTRTNSKGRADHVRCAMPSPGNHAPVPRDRERPLAESVYKPNTKDLEDIRLRREHRRAIRIQAGRYVRNPPLTHPSMPSYLRHSRFADRRWTAPAHTGESEAERRERIEGLEWRRLEFILGHSPMRHASDEGGPLVAYDRLPGPAHEGPSIDGCAACERRRPNILVHYGLSPAVPGGVGHAAKKHRRSGLQRYLRRFARLRARTEERDRGEGLTDRELSQREHTYSRRAMCGAAVAVLERDVPSAGLHKQRIETRMMCGLRGCEACDTRRRHRAIQRMEGPWTQFVTFTIPRGGLSRGEAWRKASKWMTKLMSRLYDMSRRGRYICDAENCCERAEHVEMNVPSGKLEYAWVIEPHKDGWPHWHMCWTASYVCYDLLRELWEEITGLGMGRIQTKPVTSMDGVCRYLTKYMTKARFPDDILCWVYRKRLWASTQKAPTSWDQGFIVLDRLRYQESSIAGNVPRLPKTSNSSAEGIEPDRWVNAKHIHSVTCVWELDEQAYQLGRFERDERRRRAREPVRHGTDSGSDEGRSLECRQLWNFVLQYTEDCGT